MRIKELLKRLERRNPQRAYYLDFCRRDMLRIFETPIWLCAFVMFFFFLIGLYHFAFGMMFIILFLFLGMSFVNIFYFKKFLKELKNGGR